MHSVECPLFVVVVVVYMETAALKARSLCHEVYVISFNSKEIRHFVTEFENHSNVLYLNLISLECQSPLFCFVGVVVYMGLTKPKKGVCFISFSAHWLRSFAHVNEFSLFWQYHHFSFPALNVLEDGFQRTILKKIVRCSLLLSYPRHKRLHVRSPGKWNGSQPSLKKLQQNLRKNQAPFGLYVIKPSDWCYDPRLVVSVNYMTVLTTLKYSSFWCYKLKP